MEEIKFCPYQTYKERKPTNDGWIETKRFMPCIGDDCPHFYIQESGDIFNPSFREKCKKKKKKKGKKKDKYWLNGDDLMKIRNDYVTNSSSSSYVIAIHKDANIEDEVKKFVLANKEASEVSNYEKRWGCGTQKKKEKDIQKYLSCELHTTPLLTLGDWKIYSGTADSDDGYIDRFLYNSLDYDSEYFKKGSE